MTTPLLPPLAPLLKQPPSNDWAMALLNGFSQIFLQRHPLCGLLCLLAVAWGAPSLLGGMLLGSFSGWLTAKRRHYPVPDINSGLHGYNGALLGLLISTQLADSPLLPLLIIGSAGLSSMLLQRWLRHNRKHASLPAYTAPFVMFSWLLLALTPSAPSSAAVPVNDLVLLDLPLAVLRGLSQVLFVNDACSGLLIAIGLWLANHRLALWALVGAGLGLAIALLLGQSAAASQGLYGFNSALVAIVLSQQQRPLRWLLSGIVLAPLLQFSGLQLGIGQSLTAPFILTCWLLQSLHNWRQHKQLLGIF